MSNKSKKKSKKIGGGFFQSLFGKSKSRSIDRRKKILYTDEDGTVIKNPLYRVKLPQELKKKSKKIKKSKK